MRKLIYAMLLVSTVSVADNVIVRDSDGFVRGTFEEGGEGYVFRDLDGFVELTIDEDGTVRDNDGFAVGEIE